MPSLLLRRNAARVLDRMSHRHVKVYHIDSRHVTWVWYATDNLWYKHKIVALVIMSMRYAHDRIQTLANHVDRLDYLRDDCRLVLE